MTKSSTRQLLDAVPQVGRLTDILVRPVKYGEVARVPMVEIVEGLGLAGDHRATRRTPDARSKRHVTLLQAEHLPVVASLLGLDRLDAARLRRNLVVAGINLASLRDRRFRIGAVVLEGTGHCHPCSRMESELGPGGFQALRGHGGITARIVTAGRIHVGDVVETVEDPATPDPGAPVAQ